ncbi:MAG: response regulator receiver/ANTAR protein [Proteobacteria bacterium]|nr:response regulator receiver/ANTAR protein [Pseudomonadota bacterium]
MLKEATYCHESAWLRASERGRRAVGGIEGNGYCLILDMLRILVIDESQSRAAELCAGLIRAGHQVAAVLSSALDLNARIREIKPDVILIETDAPSRDTLENLAVMDRDMPRPVIIFSQDSDSQTIRSAMKAGVSAYVVDGLEISRLKPIIDVAVARFEEHQSLRKELAEATRKLSDRKVVDKAKGILMKTRGLDEEQAYAALRKLAMERAKPMAQVAQDLLDMAKLLL